jgi:SAM-dependent methyltransferase
MFETAMRVNKRNILDLASDTQYPCVCDLGCDDGRWTAELAKGAAAKRVVGIEIVQQKARLARSAGIDVVVADLTRTLPFADRTFDLVHANQVIEHLADIDTFLAEIHRVLKPGGVAIVSTENGSSWHNIFAAIMGWQIFSLTNVSICDSSRGFA